VFLNRLVDAARVLVGAATVDSVKPAQDTSGSSEQVGSVHASRYATAIASIREVAKWLIGALAAVATIMLAGTQLSSLGSLPTQPSGRLWVAGIAALVAVMAVVRSIYLLSTVLMVQTSSLTDLRENTRPTATTIQRIIDGDPGFLEGRPSVAKLLDDYAQAQRQAISAADAKALAQQALLDAKPTDEEKAQALVKHAIQAASLADALRERLGERVRSLVELDGYVKVRASFDKARKGVIGWAAVSAIAVIVFAWAANPAKAEDERASITQHPPSKAAAFATSSAL